MKNHDIAAKIRNLDSSLKQGIVLSIGMTLAGLMFGKVEKYNSLVKAEEKFGRIRLNIDSGEPEKEVMLRDIEQLGSYYNAVLEAFPDAGYIELANGGVMGISPEAYALNRATPYLRTASEDEINIIRKATGQTADEVRQAQWKQAEMRADAFSRKAPAVLADVESFLAMAPTCDFEDIPDELVSFEEKVEQQIRKFRAAIAAGKKWDIADIVLFNNDVEQFEGLANLRAA